MNSTYSSGLFWTVKIAGVSGSGKTTILRHLKTSVSWCNIITYSDLLIQFRIKELADAELSRILENSTGLIVMDEHLEFVNPNRTLNYRRENTRGLVYLDLSLPCLLNRISSDPGRKGVIDRTTLQRQLAVSRRSALRLSRKLSIPLLLLQNPDNEQANVFRLVAGFLRGLKP